MFIAVGCAALWPAAACRSPRAVVIKNAKAKTPINSKNKSPAAPLRFFLRRLADIVRFFLMGFGGELAIDRY